MKKKIMIGLEIEYEGEKGEVRSLPDVLGEIKVKMESGKTLYLFEEDMVFVKNGSREVTK